MITIIFGKPGAGKTSLMTHLMTELYHTSHNVLLKRCCMRIEEQNRKRTYPLPLPDKPPIFANYGVTFRTGYKQIFSPYYFNPYYFGIGGNDPNPVQYLLPCGYYYIDEGQRFYNSRKSLTLPDRVSKAFELHRQFEMNIYIVCQRPKLIDLNIRELSPRFLEVQSMEHEITAYGGILSTTWQCREFGSSTEVLEYLECGTGGHKTPPFTHRGNIFEVFDSFEQKTQFYPADKKDQGFNLLPFRPPEHASRDELRFYDTAEPKWFRQKSDEKEKEN